MTVYLACNEAPLAIKKDIRDAIIEETLDRVRAGEWGTRVTRLEQSWAATPWLDLAVRVFNESNPLVAGPHVVVENGFDLGNHLRDVEAEVLKVLSDEQKIKQAEARPTILLVDAARTGNAWMRPEQIWARRLADLLPQDTPFVGVAVMIPRLDRADAPISIALRGNAPAEDLDAAKKLAVDLGLELNE
ncbi:hypothetical protein ACFRAR_30645 [Kitasatospora sp. NPDC056651]|uniref:hypothetical protein n=1 Tax=Kitasatospora sp. NPDC056651 TaxID=3345892 RepID=UPI0036C5637F